MYAVSSCELLSKVVKEAKPLGTKASDIGMLRQASIQEAILSDRRDNLARQGKTQRTSMTAIDAADDPEYAIFMAHKFAQRKFGNAVVSSYFAPRSQTLRFLLSDRDHSMLPTTVKDCC